MTSRFRPNQMASSIRHSSPKSDASRNTTELTLSDSIASAILPVSNIHQSTRRRSLSSDNLTTSSSTVLTNSKTCVRNDRNQMEARRQLISEEWAFLKTRLSEIAIAQNQNELDEVRKLLLNSETKLGELRTIRHLHDLLADWLRVTKSLEAENSLLVSMINSLHTSHPGVNDVCLEPSKVTALDYLKQVTLNEFKPAFDRLALRGFVFTPEELKVELPYVKQFALNSDVELEKLEKLADLIEDTATQLEQTSVPIARAQSERIIQATQLLAEEASLRFGQLQRMWLSSCSALSSD